MHDTTRTTTDFRLGEWLVQRDLNQLIRDDVPVRIEPKAMEVLCALADRPQQTVPRDTLLNEIWGDRVVVEEALSRCITQLRRALDDDVRQPRYIKTIPKRGYRLLLQPQPVEFRERRGVQDAPSTDSAPVVPAAASSDVAPIPVVAPAPDPNRPGHWVRMALLLGLLIALSAVAFYPWRSSFAPPRSIAVLSFANLTGDEKQSLLCEGAAESLVTALTRVPGLKVIARQSSIVASQSNDLRDTGRRLHIEAVVAGNIRAQGDSMRINARLVRVADGAVLWALETQGRASQDTLQMQDEIAASLLAHLRPQGTASNERARPKNALAYRLYLEGRHFLEQRTAESLELSTLRLEEAIRLEPGYAQAYAALAETHLLRSFYGGRLAPTQAVQNARVAANRALEIDPDLSSPRAVLAAIYMQHDWDWTRAEAEFKRALSADPNNSTALQWYGEMLQWQGRFAEARVQLRAAFDLDPLSMVVQTSLAGPDQWSGQYEAAAARLRRVLELDPTFTYATANLGLVLEARGDLPGAIAQFEKAQAAFGRNSPYASLAHAYAKAGRVAAARAILAELLQSGESGQYVSPFSIAVAHMGLNEPELALDWLDKALLAHDDHLVGLAVEPRFASLREHPRFRTMLATIGLTGAR